MTPLSTLTPEALHALVAQSLEGVTEGPVEVGNYTGVYSYVTGKERCVASFHLGAGLFQSEAEANAKFYAQSRDLVPELDRRLRETEAKLEAALVSLNNISNLNDDSDAMRDEANFGLDRIANLTQP